MHVPRRSTLGILGVATTLVLAGCDGSTAADPNITLAFASPAVAGASEATPQGLSITGTNGTLLITDIRLVVDELELERDDVADCDDDIEPDPAGCEEFELRVFPVDVPLGTGVITIANDRLAPGTYDEIEFEAKDLEVDANDPDDASRAARIAEVLAQLRQTFPDWPAKASMVVIGTFTPTGGAPQAFKVYFEADVDVETQLATPIVIDGTSTGVTIDLRPDLWFRNEDGTVRNLALLDFGTTGLSVEFEVEFERGIEVEIDD